jgi:enamine deaminase RidA (YjgF/YER057c/UK114 family)
MINVGPARIGRMEAVMPDQANVGAKAVEMRSVEAKLAALGLALPPAPRPLGAYQATVEADDGMLYISAQVPLRDGNVIFQGRVGEARTIEEGRDAARLTALNVLAQIVARPGGFERLVRIVRVEGYVSSADGFFGQPAVLDGASDLFAAVLGDKAGHARSAFSQSQLPANATVILVVTAQMKPLR